MRSRILQEKENFDYLYSRRFLNPPAEPVAGSHTRKTLNLPEYPVLACVVRRDGLGKVPIVRVEAKSQRNELFARFRGKPAHKRLFYNLVPGTMPREIWAYYFPFREGDYVPWVMHILCCIQPSPLSATHRWTCCRDDLSIFSTFHLFSDPLFRVPSRVSAVTWAPGKRMRITLSWSETQGTRIAKPWFWRWKKITLLFWDALALCWNRHAFFFFPIFYFRILF